VGFILTILSDERQALSDLPLLVFFGSSEEKRDYCGGGIKD